MGKLLCWGYRNFFSTDGILINVKWLLFVCLFWKTWASDSFTFSLDDLHAQGVEAYLENDWSKCIESFTSAAVGYRNYVKKTAACRKLCKAESSKMSHMHSVDIENLHFYETVVNTTLCLLKCRKYIFEGKFETISADLDKLYARMKPYEYLHLCYYQKKMHQEAASASFTVLVADPENKVMADNLKFYTDLPDVKSSEIVNLEIKEFVPLYSSGVESYKKNDFSSAVMFFEKSLDKWLEANEECRMYCESPFDQGWLPDFTSSIANHFTFCLRCKRKCESLLSSLNGEYRQDILPRHYNYLQYAYYKEDNLKKACEAVESYLLFFPDDKLMLQNKDFYIKYLVDDSDFFHAREEAYRFVQRKQYEDKLLKYIDTEFKAAVEVEDDRMRELIKEILKTSFTEDKLEVQVEPQNEIHLSREEL